MKKVAVGLCVSALLLSPFAAGANPNPPNTPMIGSATIDIKATTASADNNAQLRAVNRLEADLAEFWTEQTSPERELEAAAALWVAGNLASNGLLKEKPLKVALISVGVPGQISGTAASRTVKGLKSPLAKLGALGLALDAYWRIYGAVREPLPANILASNHLQQRQAPPQ